MIYKLIENKEDNNDQLIEKSGSVHTFTVSAIKENIRDIEKKKKELTAQKELEDAKMTNYGDYHAFVKDLSEEERQVVYLYQTSFSVSKMCEAKLKEIEVAEEEISQAIKDIAEQTGLIIL